MFSQSIVRMGVLGIALSWACFAVAIEVDSATNGSPTAELLALNVADTTGGVAVVAGSANFTINTPRKPSSDLQSIGSFTSGITAPGTPLPLANDPDETATYAGGIDLATGVCLSTGFVSDTEQSSPAGRGVGVEGPNNGIGITNSADGEISRVSRTPADSDFAMATGFPGGGDATVLQFDVVTGMPGFLRIRFVFGSDEYPQYIHDQYNDSFALFIDGENIATITKNSEVSPFSLQEIAGCASLFRKNDTAPYPSVLASSLHHIPGAPRYDVEFGGFTTALSRETCLVLAPGTYRVKIVVQDVSDHKVDTGLFVEENSLKLFSFLLGDADLDGLVGQGDLDVVLLNWGETGNCYTEGDLDGDGLVGQGDLDLVQLNWGNSGGNKNFCADFNRDGFVNSADQTILNTYKNVLLQCASRFEGDANGDGKVDAADQTIYNTEASSGNPSGMCAVDCCGEQQQAMAGGGGESAVSSEALVQAHLDKLDFDEDADFDDDDIALWKAKLGAENK